MKCSLNVEIIDVSKHGFTVGVRREMKAITRYLRENGSPGKMIETKIFVVWGTTTLGTYYQKCGTDRRICIHVILKNDIPELKALVGLDADY